MAAGTKFYLPNDGVWCIMQTDTKEGIVRHLYGVAEREGLLLGLVLELLEEDGEVVGVAEPLPPELLEEDGEVVGAVEPRPLVLSARGPHG
jgi:hypothetical protein